MVTLTLFRNGQLSSMKERHGWTGDGGIRSRRGDWFGLGVTGLR